MTLVPNTEWQMFIKFVCSSACLTVMLLALKCSLTITGFAKSQLSLLRSYF